MHCELAMHPVPALFKFNVSAVTDACGAQYTLDVHRELHRSMQVHFSSKTIRNTFSVVMGHVPTVRGKLY